MLILRPLIFTFLLLIAVSVIGVGRASAQSLRLTSFSELGNLNGETLYSEVDYPLELRAVPAANNQGGTYQWTIGGNFQFVSGNSTSRNVVIKWTTASSTNTVQLTYSGPSGTSSAMLNVIVTTAAERIELVPLPCSQEGTLGSPSSAIIPSLVVFGNTTNQTIKLYYLNSNRQRVQTGTMTAGQGIGGLAWIGYYWLLSDENGSCLGIYQAIRQVSGVTIINVSKVEFEKILADSEPLSLNPNAEGGTRFYPDKISPGEGAIRNQVRVKATLSQYVPNKKIYFRNFDVDDPSANTAPIDDDTGANANAEDNRGMVGTSKAGLFDTSQFPACARDPATNLWGCPVDANGVAIINFTTTMNPGDNFAIAASLDPNYLAGITVNGTNLKDTNMATLPIPPNPNPDPNAIYALLRGARSQMLTVWRKIHLEVDSMGNVGASNNVTGTITGVRQVLNPNCNPLPPPAPPPSPPCYPTNQVFDVMATPALEVGRFINGRIVIGQRTFNVDTNIANVIALKGVPPQSGKVKTGDSFTLYDDDDYNANDNRVDGDFNEQIIPLPESFKYISAEDGSYSDGKPKNLYAAAYIMPEYNWAQARNYNQTNLPFVLNVNEPNLDSALTTNRNSLNDERDDFWIAYFLIAYQEDISLDADGLVFDTQTQMYFNEPGVTGVGRGPLGCDCYQAGTCVGTSCASISPKGNFGSLIFQETMQDVTRTFLLGSGLAIENKGTTAPHELGHQFGLRGDNKNSVVGQPDRTVATYRIMDYPHRPNETDDYGFHPEHINIMRWRVKSPGE